MTKREKVRRLLEILSERPGARALSASDERDVLDSVGYSWRMEDPWERAAKVLSELLVPDAALAAAEGKGE